mgnify:CR=1 FL=1
MGGEHGIIDPFEWVKPPPPYPCPAYKGDGFVSGDAIGIKPAPGS